LLAIAGLDAVDALAEAVGAIAPAPGALGWFGRLEDNRQNGFA
jgi:hypothetical protein